MKDARVYKIQQDPPLPAAYKRSNNPMGYGHPWIPLLSVGITAPTRSYRQMIYCFRG